MQQVIPWICFGSLIGTREAIEYKTGLKVSDFPWGDRGLVAVLDKEFPIILVQDEVKFIDTKNLPSTLQHFNYRDISRYVIQTIKASNAGKITPVVAIGNFDRGRATLKYYREAGADEIVNMWTTSEPEASEIIYKLLRK